MKGKEAKRAQSRLHPVCSGQIVRAPALAHEPRTAPPTLILSHCKLLSPIRAQNQERGLPRALVQLSRDERLGGRNQSSRSQEVMEMESCNVFLCVHDQDNKLAMSCLSVLTLRGRRCLHSGRCLGNRAGPSTGTNRLCTSVPG